MGQEQVGSYQESQKDLTPRQKLEGFLSGEKPGSIKILALSDIASLKQIVARRDIIESRERGKYPPSHDYIHL